MSKRLPKAEWKELCRKKAELKAEKAKERCLPCDYMPDNPAYVADPFAAAMMITLASRNRRSNWKIPEKK